MMMKIRTLDFLGYIYNRINNLKIDKIKIVNFYRILNLQHF